MRVARYTAMVLAVVAAAVPMAAAEETGSDEIVGGLAFLDEIQVTVVNVDVFVRDGGGKPVSGLTAEDFRILQNGIEMPVSNFAELDAEVIRHRIEQEVYGAPAATETAADEPATELEIRPIWVVLYIDHENIEALDRNRVLRRVREFVTENLDQPVQMMVVSYLRSVEVVQPFTSQSSEVTGALRSMTRITGGREERESAREDLIRTMADAKNRDYGTDRNTQHGAKLDMRQRVAAFAAEEVNNLRLSLGGLRQVIAMLSGIEGRKSIIYVSSGLPMDPGLGLMHDYAMAFGDQSILSLRGRYGGAPLFQELISLANAQEVSLYAIDATGLNPLDGFGADSAYSRDPTASSLGSKNYRSSLVAMADGTGGIAVVNTNDVAAGLKRITNDLFSYYSLGYTISASGEDRVHRIKVELTGDQDFDLRYRRRYIEKSIETKIQDRVFSSLVVDVDDNPMGLELTVDPVLPGAGDQQLVPVHLSIDLRTVALMPFGDELVGQLVVFIGARDDEGRNSEVQRQQHEIRLPRDDYLAAGRERFGIDFRLLLTGGRHRIAVGVLDPITRQASYARRVVRVQ